MARNKKSKLRYFIDKPDYSIIKLTHKKHRHLVSGALHYAQYEMTDKQLIKAIIAYAKTEKLDFKLLRGAPDWRLVMLGKYATILNSDGELPEDYAAGFVRGLDELFELAKIEKEKRKEIIKEKKETNVGPVLTVQDRMRMQTETIGAVFDEWLDDLMSGKAKKLDTMDPATQMKLAGFKAGQARWLKGFYGIEIAEIQEVIAGKDKQLTEGYKNIKKSCLLRVAKLLDNIIVAAEMIETVAVAQRKTRKKKLPTTAKLIAKLKYCERHDATGVASISPAGIIGASEVWVYNTKYRKLGHYVAADASGLSVKGASITGFAAKSVQKTLRKPKEQLKDFMRGGKVALRKFLGNIKAVDTKLNGRINSNIVILKIMK